MSPEAEKPKRPVGRPGKFVDPEEVRRLHREGLSFRAIARQAGLGYGTVRRAYHGIPTTSRRFNARPAEASGSPLPPRSSRQTK